MPADRDVFNALTALVLERTASPEELERFRELLRAHPEFIGIYRRQVLMATLLPALPAREKENGNEGGNRQPAIGSRDGVSCPSGNWEASVPAGHRTVWWKVAAAAVLLLGGIAVWQSVSLASVFRLSSSALRPPVSLSPVTLVSQSGVRGLDLPDALPGTVRLSAGEAVVRLGSGVQLTVLGPSSLEVHNVMEVTLESGRLLANVPHWATGFLVRTADLDVYDLGTVFSVSVDWPVSDVFVFKGRVRVNEAGHSESGNAPSGEVVGICEAGEGVRAEAGERPVKFAADWPAARKVFASVRDQAATEKPAVALVLAEKIADLWTDAYLPREMSRLAAQRLAAASVPKVPFSKTAWVRSAAPQQEASNMNTTKAAAVLTAATVMMGAGTSLAFSDPVLVQTSPCINRHWSTVYTNEVPLRWNWATTATRAELEITGMNGSFTTNFMQVTSNYVWRAFPSRVPSAEDVYDLELTFYSGSGVAVGALTSRLVVVVSAFGETAVDPGPSTREWTMVRNNVVIPYDATWTAATADATQSRFVIAKVGGALQTNALADASGYCGWKLKRSDWGYGTFNLTLTFPGTVTNGWDASLTRPMDGTMIRMQ